MSTYIKSKNLLDYEDCPAFLHEFLRYIVTIKGLSIKTANSYYINIRLFLRYIKMLRDKVSQVDYLSITIDDLTLNDLTLVAEEDVLNYIFFLANIGNSVSTRGDKLSVVKSLYKYLCATYPSKFIINPTEKIDRPQRPKRQPKYLTLSEALALLDAAKQMPNSERDFCITTLFLNCGMRLSELASINVNSISENTIKIIGKGNKERTIYLNESSLDSISKWLNERKKIDSLIDNDAMFVSKLTRKRLTGRAIEKIIEKELSLAGLAGKGYSPHKLRHTAATLMHDAGADVIELKEILGHEHTTTTEIYTHVNDASLRDVTRNNPLNNIKQ